MDEHKMQLSSKIYDMHS